MARLGPFGGAAGPLILILVVPINLVDLTLPPLGGLVESVSGSLFVRSLEKREQSVDYGRLVQELGRMRLQRKRL